MKHLLTVIMATCLMLGTRTLSAESFDSKVSEVVVYKTKARETRYLKIPIKQTGRQEIVLTNISKNIEPASLQVGVTGARLISASTKLNYLSSPTSGKIKVWQDSLDIAENNLGWLKEQAAVYQGELKQLSELIKVDGDETAAYTKAAEDMLNLYRSRSLKIREILFEMQKEEKKLQQQVNNLRQQINASGNQNAQPVQEVILMVDASKAGEIQVKCQYLVSGASWEPVYNLRASALDQPIQAEMMAIVRQYTGYDWDNVQLTLSTSDPSANQSRPIMTPEYIDFFRQNKLVLQETVVTSSKFKANMAYSPEANRADSDADGVDDYYDIEPVETSTAQLYTFKGPQQIKTGKEDQKILVNTVTMPAEFIYHTVPKKDQTAYLIAKIPQWEQYNLLTGQASIFFEETYVGNTTINPKVVSDTLLLSMGRDELISIERKSVKDVSSTKLLGTSKREVKVFEINIKNNKKTEAKIEVLDQIPVSRQNDIVVELESQDGAEYTAENGRLKWIFTLQPGESKKIRFSYSLKYPGNQQIIIRN